MGNNLNAMLGVVHGKVIEIEGDLNLPDGQKVTVIVRPLVTPGEAIRRSAGGWSDDPEGLDQFLTEMRRLRDLDRPELSP